MAATLRFLIDRTSSHLVNAFPQSQTVEGFGLPENVPDAVIFAFACQYRLTIVTENDRHFSALMVSAANRSGKRSCAGDGCGLVVPNHQPNIQFGALTRRLHLNGHLVTWGEVQVFNLRVLFGVHEVVLGTLPRCKFCRESTNSPRARTLSV